MAVRKDRGMTRGRRKMIEKREAYALIEVKLWATVHRNEADEVDGFESSVHISGTRGTASVLEDSFDTIDLGVFDTRAKAHAEGLAWVRDWMESKTEVES